ncbi:MAG: helix-turn-helix domain-containing protein [bacterium]
MPHPFPVFYFNNLCPFWQVPFFPIGADCSRSLRGRRGGRPKSLHKVRVDLAKKLHEEKKHTVSQICNIVGVSPPTLYAYIKIKSGNSGKASV